MRLFLLILLFFPLKEIRAQITDYIAQENRIEFTYNGETHSIYFNSEIQFQSINSVIKIFNKDNYEILETTFQLDTSISSYRLYQHDSIEQKATQIKNEIQVNELSSTINSYKFLIQEFKLHDFESFNSEMGISVYFHLAIYNTAYRSLNNQSNCECLPIPFYLTGQSPFICQNDLFIDRLQLLESISESGEELSNLYGAENVEALSSYLANYSEQNIRFDEIYFDLEMEKQDFNNLLKGCLGGSGKDHGCCGNYSGCCWYRSLFCLIHDRLCSDCSDWYCGGRFCVPD